MAAENKTPVSQEVAPRDAEIRHVALLLFTERSANSRNPLATAKQSFKDAEVFLSVRDQYDAGELSKNTPASVLADCFSPNLKKSHVYNLVSQEFGSIARIREINAALLADPLRKDWPDQDWDEPTTNLARAILPHYVKAADKAGILN